MYLLRGNHELRRVNGWEAWYGARCLLAQCKARFGPERGWEVWEAVNHAFDMMPMVATVDDELFCTHGGIPRPIPRRLEKAASDEISKDGIMSPPGIRRSLFADEPMAPAEPPSCVDLALEAIERCPAPAQFGDEHLATILAHNPNRAQIPMYRKRPGSSAPKTNPQNPITPKSKESADAGRRLAEEAFLSDAEVLDTTYSLLW